VFLGLLAQEIADALNVLRRWMGEAIENLVPVQVYAFSQELQRFGNLAAQR